MNKLSNFRISLSIIIAAFLVTIGYELKNQLSDDNQYYFIVVVIASFIISKISVNFISKFILGSSLLREIIMGNSSIEGIWEFKTENDDPIDSDLALENRVKISYQNNLDSFKVVGVRTDENEKEINSNSIFTHYNSNTGQFINVTQILDSNQGKMVSLTYGEFFSDYKSTKINKYNGIILADGKEHPIKLVRTGVRYMKEENKG